MPESLLIDIAQTLTFPDSLVPLYIAFLAWDKFVATHDQGASLNAPKVPGEADSDVESDVEKVTGMANHIAQQLLKEGSVTLEEDDLTTLKNQLSEFSQELVRAGGAELHNISAVTGGTVSQEIIKVITEQYVPVDNTCIFDGVKSKTAVFRV